MTTKIALTLDGVDVDRGGRQVLAAVSFTLSGGETLLLKGANGSGKSTLLRAIAGLLPSARGTIIVDVNGARASGLWARRKAAVYCGHADAVKGAHTVRETLAFWTKLYAAPPGAIAQAARALDLERVLDLRAALLSAGQRRRLGVARVVMARKPLWLLDEPGASMDAASTERLGALIADHCSNGGCALIATHDAGPFARARSIVLDSSTP